MSWFPVTPANLVTSVNAQQGVVVLAAADVGATTPAALSAATRLKPAIVALTGASLPSDIVTALQA